MTAPDPVFAAIARHRDADAAWDAEPESEAAHDAEFAALVDLLRTKPTSPAGCVALLRYVAELGEHIDCGLFAGWIEPAKSAGEAFLPMIADAIECDGIAGSVATR